MNAIKLHEEGRGLVQVARDLGIPKSTFSGWVKQYAEEGENAFLGSGNIKASKQDIVSLQRELIEIKLERDILKKALAIFSKQK